MSPAFRAILRLPATASISPGYVPAPRNHDFPGKNKVAHILKIVDGNDFLHRYSPPQAGSHQPCLPPLITPDGRLNYYIFGRPCKGIRQLRRLPGNLQLLVRLNHQHIFPGCAVGDAHCLPLLPVLHLVMVMPKNSGSCRSLPDIRIIFPTPAVNTMLSTPFMAARVVANILRHPVSEYLLPERAVPLYLSPRPLTP